MTTHELMELAALDALGLLDADERESFESAFRAAPPALQAQVRREQLRVAHAEAILPAVEPPLGLKARVLAAVREAMSTMAARKAAATAPLLRASVGVSSLWRIGAIGSLAAAIVCALALFQIRGDNQSLNDAIASGSWTEHFMRDYGVKFDQAFFDPTTRMVTFAPHNGATRSKAAILFDPETKRAQLYCKDLPTDDGKGKYEVLVIDRFGNTAKAVLTFLATTNGVKGEVIEGLDLQAAKSIAIRRVGAPEPLLVTSSLSATNGL